MTGFESPNYTQTPNDLFDALLPELGCAELKVLLCVVRNTFGYHREEVKLSIRTIARATGLTVNSVMDGATKAEAHGLLERTVDGNKTTTWRAIVSVVPTKTRRLTSRDASVSPTTTLVGVKERIKESMKQSGSIENKIASGLPVTEEDVTTEKNKREATAEFESALGFGSLPWWSSVAWDKFGKWAVRVWKEDPTSFRKFAQWRANDGKFNSMSNKQIRQNLDAFMDTGWPEFKSVNAPVAPTRPEHKPVVQEEGVYVPIPDELRRRHAQRPR
jgi:hypothetical protein